MKIFVLALSVLIASSLSKIPTLQAKPSISKIAFVSAQSGSDPNTALELRRGLDVYLATQPSAAKRIKLEFFDNRGSVQETVALTTRLADQGFLGVVGIARSDEALAAAQVASERGLLFMTPFATNPRLNSISNSVLQVCYSDDAQGEALATLADKKLRAKRLLVLVNTESIYSTGLTQTFLNSLDLKRGTVIERLNYTEKDLKQEQAIELAKSVKPDVIFIPDHITRAAIFAKSLNKIAPQAKFLGGDGFGGKKILTGVFGDTPQIELYYTTHWHEQIDTRENDVFVRTYKRLFPESQPTSGAALMFDVMSILDSALKNGNRTASTISDFVRSRSFEVTTGKLKFPKLMGTAVEKPIVVLRLKNGEYGFDQTIR